MRSFLLGKLRKDPAEELNDEGEVVDGGEDPGACSESVWKLKHLPSTCQPLAFSLLDMPQRHLLDIKGPKS